MRSGRKNCYVAVERFVESVDATTNAPIHVWSLWRNAWCDATPRRGREVAIEGQPVAESYIRFDFDYLDIVGITELDRIVHEGVTYEIAGLLPDLSTKETYVVDAVAKRPATGRT